MGKLLPSQEPEDAGASATPGIPSTMHASMTRLYEASQSRFGVDGPYKVGRLLKLTPQSLMYWERRGVNQIGALLAQDRLGCDADWLLHGLGGMLAHSRSKPGWSSFGLRLSLALRHGGTRRIRLAGVLGVDLEVINHALAGREVALSAEQIDAAARFTGVNTEWLAGGLGSILRADDT
jgi:hypothetical protein